MTQADGGGSSPVPASGAEGTRTEGTVAKVRVPEGIGPAAARRVVIRPPVVLTLALLAAAAFALAFVASPLLSFRALRSAAHYGDSAALAELIDYEAVRAGLRPQLIDPVAYRSAPPPDFWHDPLGSLKQAWRAQQLIPVRGQADVNAYLSPAALDALLGGQGDPRRPPTPRPATAPRPWPKLLYADLHRIRLGVPSPGAPGRVTVFTLHRGRALFAWKLVAIGLPSPSPPAPKPP